MMSIIYIVMCCSSGGKFHVEFVYRGAEWTLL